MAESNYNIEFDKIENENGQDVYFKISEFSINGSLRITGRYPQNYVDFDKYDITPIRVLPDVNFKFIISLREDDTSNTFIYYTSKSFFDELISSYQVDKEPYLVNASIKKEKIVSITLKQFKDRLESLRELELNLPIQEIYTGGLVITKNLFMNSNYKSDGESLIANPSYDLDELVRYIDWVVSKPSNNYDERLIDAELLGDWNSPIIEDNPEPENESDTTPAEDEPSFTSDDFKNTSTYPPIGRAGYYLGEVTNSGNSAYEWVGDMWRNIGNNDNDVPNYNLGRFD